MIGLLTVAVLTLLPPAPAKNDIEKVVDEMTLPGMTVGVLVTECGTVNAAYYPPARTLIVCKELLLVTPKPALRFIVAHEMAHAIIHQLDIPVPGSEEAAADEMAAVALLTDGDREAVLAAALWMEGKGGDEDVWDAHQSDRKRAAVLMCLEDGSEDSPMLPECQAQLAHAAYVWRRLIHWRLTPEVAPQ